MSTPTDIVHWTPHQAVAWLEEQIASGRDDWAGMCLALTSNAYGYGGSGVSSAADYWDLSWHRINTDRDVPVGGLALFTGGAGGYGHAMVCIGPNLFASNDIGARGKVSRCTIEDIERAWGLRYEGWCHPCYWAGWGTNPDTPPSIQTPARRNPDMILISHPNGTIHLCAVPGPAYIHTPEALQEIKQALADPAHVAAVDGATFDRLAAGAAPGAQP